jgi:hypothetical protein
VTLERDGKAKFEPGRELDSKPVKAKDEEPAKNDAKSKKKSLDELLEQGLI